MNLHHGPKPSPGPQMDPVEVFARVFALGLLQLRTLQVNVVPCMCGACHGLGVQLEGRMHFPKAGGFEVITRGDAPKPEPAKEQANGS